MSNGIPSELRPLVADVMAARPGETRSQTLSDGRTANFARSEDPSVLCVGSISGHANMPAIEFIVFAALADRPGAYPGDLPFVAEVQVSVSRMLGRSFASWTGMSRPSQVSEEISQQLIEQGWQMIYKQARPAGVDERTFQKDGDLLVLNCTRTPPLVTLSEMIRRVR